MGLVVSGVCLVHCAALPLLAIALPAAAVLLDPQLHHRFHWLMLALAIPASAFAFVLGTLRHRRWIWPAVGVAGLSLMTFAVIEDDPAGDLAREVVLTLAGATIVAIAHVLNWRALARAARA